MSAANRIERVLRTSLLKPELIHVASRGATPQQLDEQFRRLGLPIPASLGVLLQRWNGLDLDVIRIHGVDPVEEGIAALSDWQRLVPGRFAGSIAFASDPAGFLYLLDTSRGIWCVDHDGGTSRMVASGLDEFFEVYVFGPGAADFGGSEWLQELFEQGVL